MVWDWFILTLVLIFIELVTVNLVSVWFAIGAVAAMISTFFTDVFWAQVVVFIIVSAISLVITKPLTRKLKIQNIVPTNLDRVIGKRGEVLKKITPDTYGEVKVFGTVWTAASDQEIEVGTKVFVERIEGVKLIVIKEEK